MWFGIEVDRWKKTLIMLINTLKMIISRDIYGGNIKNVLKPLKLLKKSQKLTKISEKIPSYVIFF